VKLVQPGIAGKSIRAVGKMKGLVESTIRGWVKNQKKLEEFRSDNKVKIRQRRRLPGSGRKIFFRNWNLSF
jgi:transposase